MVLITILTLALALLPATQKVEAVASEMAVVYFVYATIFGSCAISFASDEDFRQGVKDFAAKASETVKNIVVAKAQSMFDSATGVVSNLSGFKISFSASEWQVITEDISKYYKTYYDQSGVTVTPSASGRVGFTADSQFTFNLTNDSDDLYYIQHIFLNKMTITLYDKPLQGNSVFDHWAMQPAESDDNANQRVKDFFSTFSVSVTNISNLALSYYCLGPSTRGSYVSNEYSIYGLGLPTFSHTDGSGGITVLSWGLDKGNFYWKYNNQYAINGVVCYLIQCSDNKLRFVSYDTAFGDESNYNIITLKNYDTNATYDSFDSKQQFFAIACDAAGVAFPSTDYNDKVDGDVYKSPAMPTVKPNVDVYNGTDNVTLTIPKSATSVDDYEAIRTANPADIIEYEKAIEYPDGVPEIDSSGLFDKFPFCIPKDLYNLFAGFYSAESKAPRFDIPFQILKQSDGSYLIDTSISFDFAIFDDIMPMVRWFTTAGFIFFLIMITRKVIGAQ